jgi:Lar family restriction alleviation protein
MGNHIADVRKKVELKPCPFCGGKSIITKHHNRFCEWWIVSCPKCHISQIGSEYEFSFEAIEAWNRRANDGV